MTQLVSLFVALFVLLLVSSEGASKQGPGQHSALMPKRVLDFCCYSGIMVYIAKCCSCIRFWVWCLLTSGINVLEAMGSYGSYHGSTL
mmetsp:Transcript_35663/g.58223  ORF Transcript_35663/g.58223 Transcript_35663/m.58223 type:complete len:88 (+) Transcript_35663:1090-1353(+)